MFKCRIIISSSGLVSIRVSNPWVMGWACWCACAHQALSVGIVTFFALASGAGRRGWGVAFPGLKVFDLVQRCWVLDPLKTLGNCHDPNVPHRGQFAKEGLCSFRNNNNKHKKISPYEIEIIIFTWCQLVMWASYELYSVKIFSTFLAIRLQTCKTLEPESCATGSPR